MRVLVTLSPRMYREAVALSIHRNRPGLDVRAAPPEEAEREIDAFRPRLLVPAGLASISYQRCPVGRYSPEECVEGEFSEIRIQDARQPLPDRGNGGFGQRRGPRSAHET